MGEDQLPTGQPALEAIIQVYWAPSPDLQQATILPRKPIEELGCDSV